MFYRYKGFSLIELMIVVALIGILTAIAMPQYQQYMTRTKVTEGIQLASSAKLAVSEYYLTHGELPSSNEQAGINASIQSQYVDAITVGDQGIVTILFNPLIGAGTDATLLYTPEINDGSITWQCSGTIEKRFRPASCR